MGSGRLCRVKQKNAGSFLFFYFLRSYYCLSLFVTKQPRPLLSVTGFFLVTVITRGKNHVLEKDNNINMRSSRLYKPARFEEKVHFEMFIANDNLCRYGTEQVTGN
jgi:hypothetical protein